MRFYIGPADMEPLDMSAVPPVLADENGVELMVDVTDCIQDLRFD